MKDKLLFIKKVLAENVDSCVCNNQEDIDKQNRAIEMIEEILHEK